MTSPPTQGPRFSLLDFGPDPIYSEPFDVTIKTVTKSAVFAEMSQRQKDRLRIQAVTEIQSQRDKAEQDAGGQIGGWADDVFDTAVSNVWCALVLQNALRDADDPTRPLVGRDVFELIPSGLVADLFGRFEIFEAGLSPSNVTEAKIAEFIEAVKKNLPASALWRRFGSSTLWGSLLFLVEQQTRSPTDASSDT
jgi:hypothetical protein